MVVQLLWCGFRQSVYLLDNVSDGDHFDVSDSTKAGEWQGCASSICGSSMHDLITLEYISCLCLGDIPCFPQIGNIIATTLDSYSYPITMAVTSVDGCVQGPSNNTIGCETAGGTVITVMGQVLI